MLGTWRKSVPTEEKILINSNISDFRWNQGENCQFIKFIKFANFEFFLPATKFYFQSAQVVTNTRFTLENASKLSFRFQKMLFWQDEIGMGIILLLQHIFSFFLNIQVNIYQILIARCIEERDSWKYILNNIWTSNIFNIGLMLSSKRKWIIVLNSHYWQLYLSNLRYFNFLLSDWIHRMKYTRLQRYDNKKNWVWGNWSVPLQLLIFLNIVGVHSKN